MRALRALAIIVLVLAGAAVPAAGAAAVEPVPNAAPAGGSYVPIAPARLLDTRTTGGPATSVTVPAGGRAGIPTAGVEALSVNLTVVSPAHTGSAVAYRADRSAAATASINFTAGHTAAGSTFTAVDASGRFTVRATTPVDVVVDVAGYFTTPDTATAAGRYVPVPSIRVYDTRGSSNGAPGPQHVAVVNVVSNARIHAPGVQAVVINVTAASPKVAGYLTAWTAGTRPAVSTLNVQPGLTRANRAVVVPDATGSIRVYASTTTNIVVDVQGYFADSAAGAYYVPLGTPVRRYDTRRSTGEWVNEDEAVSLHGADGTAVPPFAAMARPVAIAATVTEVPGQRPATAGYLAANGGVTGSDLPTSDVNFSAGQAVGNLDLIGFDTHGTIVLRAATVSRVAYTIDLVGYFATPLPATTPVGLWTAPGQNPTTSPAAYDRLAGARAVAGNRFGRSLELLADGTVYSWDSDPRIPDDDPTLVPAVTREDLPDITAIAVGESARYALDDDGVVHASGYDDHGQLGDGTTQTHLAWQPVPGLPAVTKIFATYDAAYAETADGTVYGWGGNGDGSLGNGGTADQLTPQVIPQLAGATSVAGEHGVSAAVLADGSPLVWGKATTFGDASTVPAAARVCRAAAVTATYSLAWLCATGRPFFSYPLDDVVDFVITRRSVLVARRQDGTVWTFAGGDGNVWQQVPGLAGITVLGTSGDDALASTGA